ncbi:MAG TPA: hypothetical protein VHZ33_08425 [Trebonia sp.]|nr:hypothetical protein [Trebonia sp.]
MPGRARHPTLAGLPRRAQITAGALVLVVLAHLLLAQLALGLTAVFIVVGKVSRWRLWWLTGPAAAGLIWALAIGPGRAAAGFAAGPAQILDYLGQRHVAGLRHPAGPFARAGSWLPGQLPVALLAAAAEAALALGLDRLRTGESAVLPRRPGAVAALRIAFASSLIRSGAVVTRDGCALGVAPATGAVVELGWAEIAGGVLVAGAAAQQVTVASLQIVHAALRRCKPLIVIDVSPDAAIARALAMACAATGTPLLHQRPGTDLGPVISERSAALLRVGSAELAARTCADINALAARLRRIGADGDGLIWVTGGERLPGPAVQALIGNGRTSGLAVLISTTSPGAIAELAGQAAASVILRGADPAPAPPGGPAAEPVGADPLIPAGAAVPPAALPTLSLRPGEFVLAVNAPRPRLVPLGRLVPARLPRLPRSGPGRARGWRGAPA